MEGWYKVHRKIIDSSVFDNPNLLKMWIWALSKATHVDYKQMVGLQEVSLEKGQFIFGRKAASKELKMTETYTYKLLKTLEKMKMVGINSNNKFSVVSIVNWEVYQTSEPNCDNTVTTKEQQRNNNVTTTKQQRDTNKNIKNIKNIKKKEVPPPDPFLNGLSEAEKKKLRAELRE